MEKTIDKIIEDFDYEIKLLKGKLENPITSALNRMLIRDKILGFREAKEIVLKHAINKLK